MATKRSTFQKRQRETDLKDKALAKERRRADKRNQKAEGPIARGPDGLPLNTSSDDANRDGASDGANPTANAAPPPPPPSHGYRPQQRGPGPRGMSPGPRMPTPAPAPAPTPPPAPVAPKSTGPSPMYVPSKHILNRPKTASTSTPAPSTSSSTDASKPAATTPPSSSSSSDPRR